MASCFLSIMKIRRGSSGEDQEPFPSMLPPPPHHLSWLKDPMLGCRCGPAQSELWPPAELPNVCSRSLEKGEGASRKRRYLVELVEKAECAIFSPLQCLSPHPAMSSLGT
uniref:Uncharacterized protein n=1 Tax=Micrurus spixii TaxID=129469 RepID=A0A2D4MGI4_9SAUR